jgi:hypothetical protein
MDSKEMILKEIEQMPDALLEEILDFIRFLKTKKAQEKFEAAILSESSLKKDWLRPEEDEAWQNL